MLEDAALVFRRLVDEGSREPRHLSYCGLLAATGLGRLREGIRFCEEAVQLGGYDPESCMHLVRVYELCGFRTKAIETLRRGLRRTPCHAAMLRRIQELSPRREPPFSVVSRNHPINKVVGRAIAKLERKRENEERLFSKLDPGEAG